jgi:N-acyl homoserine lactone hydrolase
MDKDGFIINRLATIGVRQQDVHTVICTHLDADHAGGHICFPDAEFIVQRVNYELALASDNPRFAALRETWNQPHLRYHTVKGDIELVTGVKLIETSGHVPGHQSVLLRLPQTGPVLLTIDAVPHSTMTDAETRLIMTGYDMDETTTRASTRKLAEVVEHEDVALTIYGHDAGQWATLRHAPDYYD